MERNLIAREIDDLAGLRQYDMPGKTPLSTGAATQIVLRNYLYDSEVIFNCAVSIANEPVWGKTDTEGKLIFDLSSLPDNQYTILLKPDYLYASNDIMELGNPSGNYPDRIYPKYQTVITKKGNTYSSGDKYVSIREGVITIKVRPIWMKIAVSASRKGLHPSLIVVHHTDDANQNNPEGTSIINGSYNPDFKSDIRRSINSWMGKHKHAPHYVIDRDGMLIKLGHESLLANHAGSSKWKGKKNLNSTSVGIEVVHTNNVKLTHREPKNPGEARKVIATPTYTEQFNNEQYESLIHLLKALTIVLNISPNDIVGHSDIGVTENSMMYPGRKSSDPGRLFDWRKLQHAGLSLTPMTAMIDIDSLYGGYFVNNPNKRISENAGPTVIKQLQDDLIKIGYACNSNGKYDAHTSRAVGVFCEHFQGLDRQSYVNLDTAMLIKRLVINL